MFTGIEKAPEDAIFGLANKSKQDTDPNKLDLVVGAYRDENGKPYVLDVVKQAEQAILDANMDKEYLPIGGMAAFCEASAKLCLGDESKALSENRVSKVQSLSGTGGIRLAAEVLGMLNKDRAVLLSNPTWGNHKGVFAAAGFTNQINYRWLDPKTNCVDFPAVTEDLNNAPDGSILVVQMCAHNPTGADPTIQQWRELAELAQRKKFALLVDAAYQGYATGDLVADAQSARLLDAMGLEFMVCQSYAKNFGCYGERIGCLLSICDSPATAEAVTSQVKVVVRKMYSNPPCHGARIVHKVLTDPVLRPKWEAELLGMAQRITKMRQELVAELQKCGAPGDWSHITKQIGMFSYTGLTKEQCARLTDEFHVYLLPSGRISIPGLCSRTVPYLAKSICAVVQG